MAESLLCCAWQKVHPGADPAKHVAGHRVNSNRQTAIESGSCSAVCGVTAAVESDTFAHVKRMRAEWQPAKQEAGREMHSEKEWNRGFFRLWQMEGPRFFDG